MGVGVEVGGLVSVTVGVNVLVGVGVRVRVGVRVGVRVRVGVPVGVRVRVGVRVHVGREVNVGRGVVVAPVVWVALGVGDSVGVDTGVSVGRVMIKLRSYVRSGPNWSSLCTVTTAVPSSLGVNATWEARVPGETSSLAIRSPPTSTSRDVSTPMLRLAVVTI